MEEQTLSPGANVAEGARSDVRVMGFSGDFQNTYFDVKVINAQADKHIQTNPRQAPTKGEEEKEKA